MVHKLFQFIAAWNLKKTRLLDMSSTHNVKFIAMKDQYSKRSPLGKPFLPGTNVATCIPSD